MPRAGKFNARSQLGHRNSRDHEVVIFGNHVHEPRPYPFGSDQHARIKDQSTGYAGPSSVTASATMTLELYEHLFPDLLDEVADRLDAAARAAVYPLCTRADIIPKSDG